MSLPELQGLLAHAEALEPLAHYDAALEALDTVIVKAGQQGLLSFEAAALYHKGKILRIKGEVAAAATCARQAAERFSRLGDGAGQAQALLVLGEILSDQGKLGEFEQACQEAIALSRQAANPLVEARGLTLLGTAKVFQGKAEEARVCIEHALQIYTKVGDRRGIATTLLMLGRVDHMGGRLKAAASAIEAAITIFEELGDRRAGISACFSLGLMHFERGELEKARHFTERGRALSEGIGEVPLRLRCLLLLAQIAVETGRWEAALTALKDAEQGCLHHDQRSTLPEVYRVMAQAYLGAGRVAGAEEYARRGRAVVAEDDPYSQGTTELVLALVVERRRQRDEAEARFKGALEHLEEAGETFEIGWGHLCYGQSLLSRGRKEQAREHLYQARQAFASLEAQGKVELIEALIKNNASSAQ